MIASAIKAPADRSRTHFRKKGPETCYVKSWSEGRSETMSGKSNGRVLFRRNRTARSNCVRTKVKVGNKMESKVDQTGFATITLQKRGRHLMKVMLVFNYSPSFPITLHWKRQNQGNEGCGRDWKERNGEEVLGIKCKVAPPHVLAEYRGEIYPCPTNLVKHRRQTQKLQKNSKKSSLSGSNSLILHWSKPSLFQLL